MKAGYDFICSTGDVTGAARIEVHLYGSLSATGKGHGTDRAVLAGLMGNPPEMCPEDFLDSLMQNETTSQTLTIGDSTLQMAVSDVVFDDIHHEFPFSNTLVIRLLNASGDLILEKEYYSVCGGFIQWKGWTPPMRSGTLVE